MSQQHTKKRRATFLRTAVVLAMLLVTVILVKKISQVEKIGALPATDDNEMPEEPREDRSNQGWLSQDKKNICQTTDAYWTDCLGERATNIGTYVGEWKDNQFHGQGTLATFMGCYTGEFRYNAYHGHGTLSSRCGGDGGQRYVGEFRNGQRVGQGTYTWDDGSKYIGEFGLNEWGYGEGTGRGIYYDSEGRVVPLSLLPGGLLPIEGL